MNNVKKQKSELRIKLEAILIMAGAFLGVLLASLGIIATLMYFLVGGASIAVYYLVARPILARHPLNSEKTPKSFLKKCVKCGRKIPIASEECPYCGAQQTGATEQVKA